MANLLFISTKTTWGGSEPLWSDAAERAYREGHSVSVVIPEPKKFHPRHEQLRSLGVRFLTRPPRKSLSIGNRVRRKLSGETRDWEMVWWKKSFPEKPDAICVSQGAAYCAFKMPGLVDWLAEQSGNFLVVCQAVGREFHLKPENRAAIRKYYSNAAKVGFTALGNLHEMEILLATKISNAYVHQNPMDFSTDCIVDWPESEVPLISCPSRLFIQDKGQDILFQVLAQPIWRERIFKLQLFGAGSDEGYLRDLAEHLGITQKLEFCGHTAGMLPIWQKTQLMILPSRSEGLPLVLVGAMAAGRPCVVTDVGGNAEWVRDGIDGFVARMPNVWSVNEALDRAWQARGDWKSMGEQARQRFLELHPKDPVGDLLREMLEISKSARK
jgi:glycosyltransferase involved in cell wall biosynthesis